MLLEQDVMPSETGLGSLPQSASRKTKEGIIPLTLLLIGMLCVDATTAGSQPVDLVRIDNEALAKGRRLSDLIDHAVVNEKNEIIGTIDDLIVDDDKKIFVVLEVGVFLHRGSRPLIAVPYDGLSIDEKRGKIELPGASREELNKVPVFEYGR